MATENVAALEPQDYTLIADAVDEYLGFDITTREQQDRITRWARAVQAPLAGPVDASGAARAAQSQKTGRAETRAVVQLAQSFKDDRDDLGITSRAVMARWILDHAAAVPSSPAQENQNVLGAIDTRFPTAPPSSPVADSPMKVTRRWTEVLCQKCGGNGVIKIPGGVSECPRCYGRCYDPAPPASAPSPSAGANKEKS